MDVRSSEIVLSMAGRDQGCCFYVLAVEGEYLLLADGKKHRVQKPKRKKQIHVLPVARPDNELARKIKAGQPVENSELRKDLATFCRSREVKTKGVQLLGKRRRNRA